MENERKPLTFSPAPGMVEPGTQPAPPLQEGEERRGLTFGEPFAPAPPVDRTETLEDVKRSAATRGAKGVLGTVIGGYGSIGETVAKDIPEFLRNRYYGMQERLDIISPEEKARLQKAPLYPEQSEAQAKGYMSPSSPFLRPLGMAEQPTYRGVTKTAEETFPALKYDARTPAGKIAGEAAEMGAQGIAGGPRGMVSRVLTGAAGGAGGEALGQIAEEQGKGELAARVVGSLGGALSTGALIHVGNSFMRPNANAQKNLLEAVYEDISKGQGKMTIEQFNAAIKNGTPVTILDLAGPKTMELLSKYAEYNGANINKVKELNGFLVSRLEDGNSRFRSTITAAFGKDVGDGLNAPAMQEAVARAGQIERDRIYGLLDQHPKAQAVTLRGMGDFVGDPIFKEAETYAREAARNPEWKIVVPKTTAEVPGTETKILQTPQGFREVPGTAGTPAATTPGNLAYYNQLKIGLDGIISKAEASGDINTKTRALAIRKKLIDELDQTVPDIKDATGAVTLKGYGSTRDIASDTFGSANAPRAGYDFFGMQNSFKRQDLEKLFRNYNPEQRELFSAGYAARLNEIAGQANGIKALASKFAADRNFQERARMALGQERYDAFRGKVLSEDLLRKADEIQFVSKPASVGLFTTGAGGAGMVGMTAADYLMRNFSPETAGRAAVAALGGAALGAGFTVAERQMAARLIPMAADRSPEAALKFSKMLDGSPMARRVFNKMNTALNTTQQQATKAYLAQPSAPQEGQGESRSGFARGGAISAEAHADRLVSAAEKAHKQNQKTTEPLLNAHDNVIAKALEIANENF